MKFVHPEILWGLSAIAIPIIVHLFNFRKFKKVLFSNVAFLQEIQHETKSKSKLKHLLILASRILAITCIVLAFAQPYFPVSDSDMKAGDKAVSIYIDNSFSSEAESNSGRLLDLAKNKAIQVVEAHQPSDRFQLVTNDFEGRHQRLVGIDEMVQLIQEVELSPSVRKYSEVVSRQNDVLVQATQPVKVSYLFSDLQRNAADIPMIKADTSVSYRIVPGNSSLELNVGIDSVWFNSPIRQLNQVEQLYVRLKNYGNEDRENVSIKLKINDQQKSVASANVPANSAVDVELGFTNTEAGYKYGVLSIDDSPVRFDNDFYFSFAVAPSISILNVTPNGGLNADPVSLVFAEDAYFKFSNASEGSLDYSSFGKYNLIVLNQLRAPGSGLALELEKFVSNGGSVCVIPAEDADISALNALTQKLNLGSVVGKIAFGFDPGNPVININYDHYLLKGVLQKRNNSNEKLDLPNVGSYFKLVAPSQSMVQNVSSMQSGDPFFVASELKSGKTYMTAVSLSKESSTFTGHSLFPTLMLRIAESSFTQRPLSYTLGKENFLSLNNTTITGDETFRLKRLNTELEIIPEHRNAGGNTEVFFNTELKEAGLFNLILSDSVVDVVAFNYDRNESDMASFSTDEITEQLKEANLNMFSVIDADTDSIGKFANELDTGKKMWYTMLVWALIFLAIEILLIKYLK
ncbi:MAG: BatA domain-containing protein [Flavobacteriales bacterium]|jgi:hypothetical protein